MCKIENFKDIKAWKHAHDLVIHVYKITKLFPKDELFGITKQIRRGVTSVTANIAEGMGRYSYKDRARFFYNSRGSLVEVENFLIIAKDLSYLDDNEYNNLDIKINETKKTLQGLINSTERIINKL